MSERAPQQVVEDVISRMMANASTPEEAQAIEAAWKRSGGGDLFKTNVEKFNQRWLESTMLSQSLISTTTCCRWCFSVAASSGGANRSAFATLGQTPVRVERI